MSDKKRLSAMTMMALAIAAGGLGGSPFMPDGSMKPFREREEDEDEPKVLTERDKAKMAKAEAKRAMRAAKRRKAQ